LSKSRIIWTTVISLAILYAIVAGIGRHIHMNRLAHDLRYGSEAKKISAAAELMKRDRLYDKVQEMPIAERIKAMDAVEKIPGELTVKQSLILLKDTEAKVRARVAKSLILLAKDHVPLLVAALKDSDENVRNGAKDALVGIGPKVIPLVQPAVKVAETRAAACDVLVRIGEPSVEALVGFLDDDDQDVRMACAASLGKIASKKGTLALHQSTKDVRAVREIAIGSLCSICDPRSTGLLVSVLRGGTDDGEVRARSARALSVIGGPQAIQALVESLGDLDLKVRTSVVSGLQRMGDPAVPAIAAAMASGQKTVREAGAQALERIDSPNAASALAKLISDSDPAIRASAARGLGIQTANPQPAMLVPVLSDGAGDVAEAASDSLAAMGPRAIPILIAALKSPASEVSKYRAAQALAKIGSPAVPSLLASLNGDTGVRKWAAYALGRTRDPRARPALENLVNAGDKDLAWVARRALDRL
jgi:HEAT repeat protein